MLNLTKAVSMQFKNLELKKKKTQIDEIDAIPENKEEEKESEQSDQDAHSHSRHYNDKTRKDAKPELRKHDTIDEIFADIDMSKKMHINTKQEDLAQKNNQDDEIENNLQEFYKEEYGESIVFSQPKKPEPVVAISHGKAQQPQMARNKIC